MMANETMHAGGNIGEKADAARRGRRRILMAAAILAAVVQLAAAWARTHMADPVGNWLAIASALAVGGLMLAFFSADSRISDEFERHNTGQMCAVTIKAMFVAVPVWLMLQQGGLVPEIGMMGLFGFLVAVLAVQLLLRCFRPA